YPACARGLAFATHALAFPIASAFGFTIVSRLGWRWGLLLALAGLPVAVAMFRLPATAPEDADPDTVGVAATSQRLRRLRSFPAVCLAVSVVGFAAVCLPILGTDYLQHHWHLQLGARGH